MDILSWILIGLGAGVTITTLMPASGRGSMNERGWRRIAGAAAGTGGALIGGYGLLLLSPAARGDALSTAVAALAGGLWVSWIANLIVSRRRPGDDVDPAASERAEFAYVAPALTQRM